MLNVAVVGSGPAGLYAAEALVKQAAALPVPVPVRVDVIDRLPTPYGLVRYGVAPDHKSIKSIAEYLRRVLEHDNVSFLGNVHLGTDVTRDDLLGCYDAVVYAPGAGPAGRPGPGGERPAGRDRPARARQLHGHRRLGGPRGSRRAAAAVGPVLAAPGGDPRHRPGHRAARGADPAGRRRAVHRDRGDAGHPGPDGV